MRAAAFCLPGELGCVLSGGQVAFKRARYILSKSSAYILWASWKANVLHNLIQTYHSVTECLLKFLIFQGFSQYIFARPKSIWTMILAGFHTVGLISVLILFVVGLYLTIVCQALREKWKVEINSPFGLAPLWCLPLPPVLSKGVGSIVLRSPSCAAEQRLLSLAKDPELHCSVGRNSTCSEAVICFHGLVGRKLSFRKVYS